MLDSSFEIMRKREAKHWWFRGRTYLLILLLKNYFKNQINLKILDVGCGTGLNSQAMADFGEVFSLDASSEALSYCRQKGLSNLYHGRLENLPFNDNCFDLVVALDVLEHIENDRAAVEEINRVLKKGGILISFVPAFKILWSEQDVILKHFRRYTRQSILNLLGNDWQCLKISYFNFLLFPFIFLARFLKNIFGLYSQKDELEQLTIFNKLFYFIFSRELFLLKYMNLPYGVSLLGVFRKINK